MHTDTHNTFVLENLKVLSGRLCLSTVGGVDDDDNVYRFLSYIIKKEVKSVVFIVICIFIINGFIV